MKRWLLCLAVCAACSSAKETSKLYDRDSLGAITFKVSDGTPDARAHFMRGMLALHSFWYDEATREFDAAIATDPNMKMAYWGAAMSRCKLLWGEDDVDAAREILRRMPDPDHLSMRENAWAVAAVELLGDGDVATSRKRFLAAMTEVHRDFPDDESATFLALAMIAAMRPEDPDPLQVRMRAGQLALQVLKHNPKHPGAAHYLIHAYDVPELAPLALPYARAYAAMAPAAFHAQHMPAHIFTRLGLWQPAIASCQAAWDASVAAAKRTNLSADHLDFHSLNWLVEINFELGRRRAADAALAEFGSRVRSGLGHQARAGYASQVASYLARTGDYKRVDELLAPLAAPSTDEPANATRGVASHCAPGSATSPPALQEQLAALDARAYAAAMQRQVAQTEQLLVAITTAQQQLRTFLQAMQPPEMLAKLDAAQGRRHAALLARARGDDRALLDVLRASVSDADQVSVGESLPSGFLAREEIGDTLLRLDQPQQAAAEYELVLAEYPRRAHSLLGAARARGRAGDAAGARQRYQELLDVWADADTGTEGLAEARAALTSR